MTSIGHWGPSGNTHSGDPAVCGWKECAEVDPHRDNLIVFIRQLVEDDLHDMGIDWDEDMEQQYGPYDTVQDRVTEILEELE